MFCDHGAGRENSIQNGLKEVLIQSGIKIPVGFNSWFLWVQRYHTQQGMKRRNPRHGTEKEAAGSGKTWCTEGGTKGEQGAKEAQEAALT